MNFIVRKTYIFRLMVDAYNLQHGWENYNVTRIFNADDTTETNIQIHQQKLVYMTHKNKKAYPSLFHKPTIIPFMINIFDEIFFFTKGVFDCKLENGLKRNVFYGIVLHGNCFPWKLIWNCLIAIIFWPENLKFFMEIVVLLFDCHYFLIENGHFPWKITFFYLIAMIFHEKLTFSIENLLCFSSN